MDVRETPEQAELRRSAERLARDLAPANVHGLEDAARKTRLARAVRDAGWPRLREDGGTGQALAGSVEAAIVSEILGASVADVPYAGPVLAADLGRRAGARAPAPGAVAFSADLLGPARVRGSTLEQAVCAVDPADDADLAWVVLEEKEGFRLGRIALSEASSDHAGTDLTRALRWVQPGAVVEGEPTQRRALTPDDLASFAAFGLALTSADLVGVMRGVLDLTVDYARQRRQFGVPVGSFQAVQHLLAEACCLIEGARSIAQYAAWTADALPAAEALAAGRAAKAYCARAARTVCETAVQVHGGIGNTWECLVHVYLRRALLSSQWFGDDGVQLDELGRERLGAR